MMIVKNRIKQARGKYITQQELADKIGKSRNTINKIENSKYIPSLDLAFKIHIALEELLLEKNPLTKHKEFTHYFWYEEENEDTDLDAKTIEIPYFGDSQFTC